MLRVVIVVVPVLLAMVFPYMAEAIGVIGGLAMTFFGAIIPYGMYLKHFNDELSVATKAFLMFVIASSSVLGGLASGQSLMNLMADAGVDVNFETR